MLCLWNPQNGIIDKIDLNFAADYSGIFVDAAKSLIWIVSDESKALFKCDYKLNVIRKYALNDNKYEGVVVDNINNLVYLVNDAASELVIYKIEN